MKTDHCQSLTFAQHGINLVPKLASLEVLKAKQTYCCKRKENAGGTAPIVVGKIPFVHLKLRLGLALPFAKSQRGSPQCVLSELCARVTRFSIRSSLN